MKNPAFAGFFFYCKMKNIILILSSVALFSCQGKQASKTVQPVIDSITLQAAKNDSIAAMFNLDKENTDNIKEEKSQSANAEKNKTNTTKNVKEQQADKAGEIKNVILDNNREQPEATGKTYRIKSFSIAGDVLSIDITYRGGCGKHTFELYSNGFLKKSLPPQIDVYLEHVKENETCSDEIKQTLKFNISALKKSGNALIVVNINSADNKVDWAIQ